MKKLGALIVLLLMAHVASAHPLENSWSGDDWSESQNWNHVASSCASLSPQIIGLGFSQDNKFALLNSLPSEKNDMWELQITDLQTNAVVKSMDLPSAQLHQRAPAVLRKMQISNLRGTAGVFPFSYIDDHYSIELKDDGHSRLNVILHSQKRGAKTIASLEPDSQGHVQTDARVIGWLISPFAEHFAVIVGLPDPELHHCAGRIRFRVFGTSLENDFH